MLLYILTGQNKEFWRIYFKNRKLVYETWSLMLKRGLHLRSYYIKRYGLLVGSFLVLNHFRMYQFRLPFRYYKSVEGFVVRNLVITILGSVFVYSVFNNFKEIKLWFVNACPDPMNVIYPDYYYPYSIFLSVSLVIIIQLGLWVVSKTVRLLLSKYWYVLLVLNLVSVFVLITVHCTVAHEGLLYVWWMPESYEVFWLNTEEEAVMRYWIREFQYWYNQLQLDPHLLDYKLVKQWAYIILDKILQI